MGRPSLLKIATFPWGMWTPSNTWFLGPTRVLNPNDISIASAIFAGLTSVTDRPTGHPNGSVTTDRIYYVVRATRPNNNN